MGLVKTFKESFNKKEVKKLEKTAILIESKKDEFKKLTDQELREKTIELKNRLKPKDEGGLGETLDDILVDAFSVAIEGSKRALGMTPFRVQIIGGIALHQGRVAEMKTGEGKTLTSTLPAFLNALSGKGVHIITVNDYLAKRDMEWMGKLYTFLGLSVSCITNNMTPEQKIEAYNCDITYGTNNEFGFDYLRDNMAIYKENLMQRPLNYAIVDEVDSILIDEARTPLIISGEGEDVTLLYEQADRFVQTLKKGVKKSEEEKLMQDKMKFDEEQEKSGDFLLDEKEKSVNLTESGTKKAEQYFNVSNLSDPENMEINHHIIQALKARNIMKKDIDYVIQDGEIIIVDEFTGRLMFGRRYSNGLHQAIEQKEKINVQKESKTLATITIQNYFRMYEKLSGMTGTAKTEEEEFTEIYNMDVVEIPTNKPMIRKDLKDLLFTNEEKKFNNIIEKIVEINETGQPVLVGTISIEKSVILSNMLKRKGIVHNVLNAKMHEKEADIIAEAGQIGSVTIATNMAGRGTDIVLGGNPEHIAKTNLKSDGFTDEEISLITSFIELDDERLSDARKKYNDDLLDIKKDWEEDHEKVVSLGGLYIIGTERHESRRIDNQLRGRSARQGDPGVSQFYLSMDDELLNLFGGQRMKAVVERLSGDDEAIIETGIISRSIENAQKKVESRNFGIRKYVLQYDNVMNKQREAVYKDRKAVLEGEDLKESILDMANSLIADVVSSCIQEKTNISVDDLKELVDKIREDICVEFNLSDDEMNSLITKSKDEIDNKVYELLLDYYNKKEEDISEEHMRELERIIMLNVTDSKWIDHIDAMDQLRTGISLRSLGHIDPAIAYAEEGYEMFLSLNQDIRNEAVRYCFNVRQETNVKRHENKMNEKEIKEEDIDPNMFAKNEKQTFASSRKDEVDEQPKSAPVVREERKIGRNEPCPCGSGKKYKNCCGKNL